MQQPKRLSRNLTDYRIKQTWGATRQIWPCLVCHGRGWRYDPADQPDIIEGYRHVRQLPCLTCGSSGEGPKKTVVEAYRAEVARYRKEKEEYEALVEAQKTAVAKLTTIELLAVKELGI